MPPGWQFKEIDEEHLGHAPRRKIARVRLLDGDSFVDYIIRHGLEAQTKVWCRADYKAGQIDFNAILNDHGAGEDEQAWRDHCAVFRPELSEEWACWIGAKKNPSRRPNLPPSLKTI